MGVVGGGEMGSFGRASIAGLFVQKIIQKQSHRFLPRYQAPAFPPSSDHFKPSSVDALAH